MFKSTVLFGTHTLLDKSLRVLQLPTHLPSLTALSNSFWQIYLESAVSLNFFYSFFIFSE